MGNGQYYEAHKKLYDDLKNGRGEADLEESCDQWKGVLDDLEALAKRVDTALTRANAVWQGSAASAMDASVTPLSEWAADAAETAKTSRERVAQIGRGFVKAERDIPPPVAVPPLPYFDGPVTWLPRTTVDHDRQEIQAREAYDRALDVMTTYSTTVTAASVTMPDFTEPPLVQGTVIDDRGGRVEPVEWTERDRRDRTDENGTDSERRKPTEREDRDEDRDKVEKPPPGRDKDDQDKDDRDPDGKDDDKDPKRPPIKIDPPPLPPPPPPVPPRIPVPVGDDVPVLQSNPGGYDPLGSFQSSYDLPPSRGSGQGGPAVSGGAGDLGGGPAGFGPGGYGRDANSDAGGRYRNANTPGGSPIGGNSPRSGSGFGTGGYGPADAPGRGAGGRGGGGGAFGPMGAGRRGEDDKEHQRPEYLMETEDVFGDGQRVAPPVIGDFG